MRRVVLLINLLILICFMSLFTGAACISAPLTGSVEEENYIQFDKTNMVVDKTTGKPISGAAVSIPSRGILVTTDGNGKFNLGASLNGPAILSIKADGYKPFSLTITGNNTGKPLVLGISKETGKEIIIDASLHHLGDDVFSDGSANADEFRISATGSYFSKKFYMDNINKNSNAILKIGSIIGLDTEIARKLGQGIVRNGISTPTKIYLNNQKIGELKINGDNQEILIPVNLLIPNSNNQITVQTGRNLYSRSRVDYDDMEFMNLVLEFR